MSSEAWRKLETRFAVDVPRFVAALRPPATPAALDHLEGAIGSRLPRELRALLSIHDGQADLRDRLPNAGIEGGHRLLSCAEIEAQWELRYGADGCGFAGGQAARFLEITEDDGDAFLVQAASGAVYFYVNYEGVFGPLAPSVDDWLRELARRLDDGRAVIEEAGTSDATVLVDEYNAANVARRFPRV